MDKYKVVIVDDDELSRENLSFALSKDERFSVEGMASNGRQGKKLIDKFQPDLLFLDVEMPDQTGMQLLQEIRDALSWTMKVVFYTAYDKYAIQAIREAAFDYLLKPFEEQELKDILERFVEQAESNAAAGRIYPGNTYVQQGQTFIVFTPTNDMRALRPSEIGFFRYCSDRKQWEVFLNNQPPLSLRRGMTAEQIIQYSPNFVQIHQSYIINIDYLMIIKESKCVLYPPFDHVTELLVSRKYKRELQERFCL
ncbi:MAG TPA: response regulator [Candidatus Bacteroides merdigallinarum]|uniref:Response regulator n=1 Tax=Candidatus Bacteroides merdigallinarum TaxID=2838473 RepID=A0A9D2EB63_9BACE|nr:response regulator [Candidatus Bacteroides merdigallinarum]